MERLAATKLFLLDMDGTFYLGDTLLPGAKEFLDICRRRGVRFCFLTNNSSKSAETYLARLARLGVKIQPEEMFTSGDATILYMRQHALPQNLLLVGTPSLEQSFADAGFTPAAEKPEAVVLGFDTGLTYEKLTELCDAVRAGLPYIATHPDYNCPVQGGFIPDIGATIAFVKASTGREPDVVIGKPNGAIAQAAAARFGLAVEELCMVGDRLYTDIALGRCGVATALVLCGETTPEDLAASDITPDHTFRDLAEMGEALERL